MADETEYNENNLNGQTRPEPPKDENGNPLPPPKGDRPQMHHGQRPPEPPKDENGNPLPPPEGGRPPMRHGQRPPEPPKDENGNPLPPPGGGRHQGPISEEGETAEPATGETT